MIEIMAKNAKQAKVVGYGSDFEISLSFTFIDFFPGTK